MVRNTWHFYFRRTKGYREGDLARFIGIADMQRLDMGIAMCHFELTARELGLSGKWLTSTPDSVKVDDRPEYIVSWMSTSE